MSDRRHARLVQPFYLKMMRTNALRHGAELLPAIAEVGRDTTPADVAALLRDPWRSSVMGAWFALLHDNPLVTEALLQALATSHGSLDSPPLATASVVLAGSEALSALEQYATTDASYGLGSLRLRSCCDRASRRFRRCV